MLPKINVPVHYLTLESTGQEIKYRPFLVKEEKILTLALASEEPKQIETAIKQIINNCILEDDIDIDSLPLFDIENIFLHLRMKSVGEIINIKLLGLENAECEECKKEKEIELNLEEVGLKKDPNHSNKIDLGHGIGLVMKYPTGKIVSGNEPAKIEMVFDMILDCIECVYDAESQTDASSVERSELEEFLEHLNTEQMRRIESFFDTMPKLSHTINLECEECGKKETHVLEGLQSFFV